MAHFTPQEIEQFLQEFFNVVGARQYTGARYVPIFGRKNESSIEWDNTKPYEPLTIVLYQGNSYTSRQYVPIGVDIFNTDYWANTGNYNAQIEQYRQETQAVSDALPIADFQSKTVKDFIDGLSDALPLSNFEETTVTDYIDDLVDYVPLRKLGAIEGTDVSEIIEESFSTYGYAFIDGHYKCNNPIYIPHEKSLIGMDKFKASLEFNSNGIYLNHRTTLKNITINISGNYSAIIMDANQNYSYLCNTIVSDIIINGDDIKNAILLTATEEANETIGAYGVYFTNIIFIGKSLYGIHFENNLLTTRNGAAWFTEVVFDDIFIQAAEYAIYSDWNDLSGNVPITSKPSSNTAVFNKVSAQFTSGISKVFAHVYNGNFEFNLCNAWDYHNNISINEKLLELNGTPQYCYINLKNSPGIQIYSGLLENYVSFVNSSGDINSDILNVTYGYIGRSNAKIVTNGRFGLSRYVEGFYIVTDLAKDDSCWVNHPELRLGTKCCYIAPLTDSGLAIGIESATGGARLIINTGLAQSPTPIIIGNLRYNGNWLRDKKIVFEDA